MMTCRESVCSAMVVGGKVQVAKNMPDPDTVRHLAVEDMKAAGIDPALIYAYKKTGMIPTEDNLNLWSKAEMDMWEAAIDEYREGH